MSLTKYVEAFVAGTRGYADYLWHEVTHPHLGNYFYWLVTVSAVVYALELLFPWRRDQPRVRRDFWLDGFYMFFNYFLFSLVGFAGASQVVVVLVRDALAASGLHLVAPLALGGWPWLAQLGAMFVIRDFVHWNIHRLLHRVELLWEFHKVHHSVVEMGFAAHLRYHWVENVVYKGLEYIPLALIGFGIDDFFWVHLIATLIGHLNHANFAPNLGPLRYLLNNARMHIWHHARELPAGHRYGINYGISLSMWDYLFGTASIPHDGRDIPLGFPGLERFPTGFFGQETHGFVPARSPSDGTVGSP